MEQYSAVASDDGTEFIRNGFSRVEVTGIKTDEFVGDEIKEESLVLASYKGHPMGLQGACNQLNQYIMEHRLQPITVGYNVTKKTDMLNPENTEIDVYVGISPNIL